ncbi:MAG: MFS transporter [Leptolyngbyaceae cyanobacterium HOT.MB2.61]|nr:MFS transporter [Leptolyngbyaceae cyanobacterium HOT.MB2.61]
MTSSAPTSASTWSPLRQPVFRTLWIASAVSTVGTWMHDVAAAWLMTSLSPSPFLVAMMSVAASLPFFLLALLAGAIADVVDRRKMLLITQGWMLAIALLMGILTMTNLTTPWLLIGLTFALNAGGAMSMPVWQAIIPELVVKEELTSAVTLNGIVINLARLIGPALAGGLIAVIGAGGVFLLNAVSFIGVMVALYRWRRTPQTTALPTERVIGAIQAGIRYTRHAPPLQTVFIRTVSYIFFASVLFALLPILGRQEMGLNAFQYGTVMGFWGVGGLMGVFLLPRLRQRMSVDRLVANGSLIFGAAILALGFVRNFYLVCAVMILVGIASLAVMVNLSVAVQTAVPGWIRARALAIQLLLFQGCMALGSLLWGAIAQHFNITTAMTTAAIGLLIGVLLTSRYRLRCAEKLDLTASLHWQQPNHAFEPRAHDGPVLITLEYRINPADAPAFTEAMQAFSRTRRRDGAIRWGLFQDLSDPGRFVETVLVESWAEHRRQFERVTKADRTLEERVRAFHIGSEPPKISQMIYANQDKYDRQVSRGK